MIEKIIVVAPTTAVPISTGLAVALNVLPAPSFSSSRSFARSKLHVEAVVALELLLDAGHLLDDRQLEHRLGVVGHRAVGVDGDRHRAHAEEPERHEAEREHGRREHQRRRGRTSAHADTRSPISDDDAQAEPVGAEVPGHEAGQDVQRGARPRATTSRPPSRARTRST